MNEKFKVTELKGIVPTDGGDVRNAVEKIHYAAMLNGVATNQLTSISARTPTAPVKTISGEAKIEQGVLKVFIEQYNELTGSLRVSTHKLLDACTIILTQQNNYRDEEGEINPLISLPLKKFMEMHGKPLSKPSTDKMRIRVAEDLNILYHISMEWTERKDGKQENFGKMRLCDRVGIERGNIIFRFSADMAKYLTNAYVMQYPIEMLKLSERNPHSYYIGKKMLIHNSMDSNRIRGTANILSVQALLDAAPDMPTRAQVAATSRDLDRRIRTPFEAALTALHPFIKWEYSNAKSVPLSEEQLNNMEFSTFENLYVKYEVIGSPDQTARLEAKAKEAEANKKRKKSTKNN